MAVTIQAEASLLKFTLDKVLVAVTPSEITGFPIQVDEEIASSAHSDKNGVFQLDLIGKDLHTGLIKHTFNLGLDYRWTDVSTINTNSIVVDTINVLQPISNLAPNVQLTKEDPVTSRDYSYGLLLQEVMTFNEYLKVSLGLRYSQMSGLSDNTVSTNGGSVWDPLVGIILTPVKF